MKASFEYLGHLDSSDVVAGSLQNSQIASTAAAAVMEMWSFSHKVIHFSI